MQLTNTTSLWLFYYYHVPLVAGGAMIKKRLGKKAGAAVTAEERASLLYLSEKSIMTQYCTPFYKAPMGVNDVLGVGSPGDLLHVFGGVWKHVLGAVLRIAVAFHNCDSDSRYKGLILKTMDDRIKSLKSGHPDLPHLEWHIFPAGLTYLATSTIQGKKASAVGSQGGKRTSWLRTMLMQILLVCRDNLFPSSAEYTFYKKGATARGKKFEEDEAQYAHYLSTVVAETAGAEGIETAGAEGIDTAGADLVGADGRTGRVTAGKASFPYPNPNPNLNPDPDPNPKPKPNPNPNPNLNPFPYPYPNPNLYPYHYRNWQ
jgi:hypothetical protein